MIKKILIPLDYSDASLNALDTAICIAGENKATLQILHVNDTTHSFNGSREPEIFVNTKEIADAMAGSILHKHGISAETIFIDGIVGPAIIKVAYENNIDLVVMGSSGASGNRELYTGSNAYFVLKHAECPVLLIPEENKWRQFKKVLYPVRPTFGALKQFDIVKRVVTNGNKNCRYEILGIHVDKHSNDPERLGKMVQEMSTQMAGGEKIEISIGAAGEKRIATEIMEKAVHTYADLVVISSTIDVSNKPFFIGPFTQQLINQAKIPILSVLRVANKNVNHQTYTRGHS